MDDKELKQDIAIDESIERIIHQKVILFYQAYREFNNLAANHSDLKEYENTLNRSVNKVVEMKNICIRESKDLIEQNENNNIVQDLKIMIADLEQYSGNLEFIVAKILNNNTIDSKKYKIDINTNFNQLFSEYNDFINKDEDVISRLTELANKIREKNNK